MAPIIYSAHTFQEQIKKLKEKAPLYPRVYIEETETIDWCTTMVIFEYNERKYKRHHVEYVHKKPGFTKVNINQLYNKTMDNAELTVKFAQPCHLDEEIFD